jgi:hypothetical protein
MGGSPSRLGGDGASRISGAVWNKWQPPY